MTHIFDHPIEFYQLGVAIIGAVCAASLLYLATRAARVYKATGENDPKVIATAAAGIRDEGFRLTKHLLIVVIGVVTIVMEQSGQSLNDRELIVRWILIIISTLMTAQSFMAWREMKR